MFVINDELLLLVTSFELLSRGTISSTVKRRDIFKSLISSDYPGKKRNLLIYNTYIIDVTFVYCKMRIHFQILDP